MRQVELHVISLAVGAVLFAVLMQALRWKLMLPGEPVSIVRLFLVKNAGNGISNLSPIGFAGDLAQAAILRYGNGVAADKLVSSLIMGRLFDLVVTVTFAGGGLILLPQLAGFRALVLPLWGATLAALVAFVILGPKLTRLSTVRRFSLVESALRSMGTLAMRRRAILGCLLITGTAWMSIGVAAWLAARAVGIDLPLWLIAIVVVTVDLFSSALPRPPGAVGVYEFAAVSMLGLFTVDPASALTFAIIVHVVLFVPSIVIAMPVLAAEGKTIRGALSAAAQAIRDMRRSSALDLTGNLGASRPPTLAEPQYRS